MDTIQFRVATPADAAAIQAIYAPYVADTSITFEYAVPPVAEMAMRIAAISTRYPYLVAEHDGLVIGYAYGAEHRTRPAYQWNAELSVYFARDRVGLGVGATLYKALIELLRRQNFRNVYGAITSPNPRSERLHERLGFTRLGVFRDCGFKLDRWYDVVWYEKHLGDPAEPPLPVIPFPELDPATERDILQ